MFKVFQFFRRAGAKGHVFYFKNGQMADKGLGYSSLVDPWTTVAVVPTMPQILNFSIVARTKDKQKVTVNGNVTAEFILPGAAGKFDFTVDVMSGGYVGKWLDALTALASEREVRAVREEIRQHNVEDVVSAMKSVEDAVMLELGGDNLKEFGVRIISCSIPKIEPDNEVAGAIGVSERQKLLTTADAAVHERRSKAAENDRKVRTYEAQTTTELEEERKKLLDVQGENEKKKAEDDATATQTRLAPLLAVKPGVLLGAALMEMAKGGVTNLAVGPELLAALRQSE